MPGMDQPPNLEPRPEAADGAGDRPVGQPPAGNAVIIGWVAVVGGPILELIGFLVWLSGCQGTGVANLLLVCATVGLIAGGIAALVVGSTRSSNRDVRRRARTLGIVAIVLGVISVPINVVAVGLTGFCALG